MKGWAYALPFIHSYGLLALFMLIFVESLGAPVPDESTLVAGSALVYSEQILLFGLYLAVVAAAILGGNMGYLIGRKGGCPLIARYGQFLQLTPERLAWIEKLYTTRGPIIVIDAWFVVVIQ